MSNGMLDICATNNYKLPIIPITTNTIIIRQTISRLVSVTLQKQNKIGKVGHWPVFFSSFFIWFKKGVKEILNWTRKFQ